MFEGVLVCVWFRGRAAVVVLSCACASGVSLMRCQCVVSWMVGCEGVGRGCGVVWLSMVGLSSRKCGCCCVVIVFGDRAAFGDAAP